ncbi:hypothetical protein M0804_013885 [Polistes exclamans]|nr:hypothetical protein M0804_013885 [Polistes exclamans]
MAHCYFKVTKLYYKKNDKLKIEMQTNSLRELRRKDLLLEKVSKKEVNTVNAPTRAATFAVNQAGSFAEERLVAARKEEDPDGKTMARVLTELSKSMIRIQQELNEIKGGQGSYAQVAARSRVASPPPTPTPLATVPDRDGFVEVRGKDANVKADKVAQALKGALPEAKIARL